MSAVARPPHHAASWMPVVLALSVATAHPALASESPPLRDGPSRAEDCERVYWLLDPMPRSCFGDIDTDRPHLTETPGVVPPGHFQLEAEPLNWGLRRDDHVPTSIGALELLAKVGVVSTVDFEVIYETLEWQRDGGSWDSETGRDLLWRLKVNLFEEAWGDFTVAPLLRTPVREDGGVEPGLLLLYSRELPGAIDLEVNLTGFAERNGEDWRAMLAPAVAFTRGIAGPVSAFAEYYGEWRSRTDDPWTTILAGGLLYLISPDLQLDAGVRLGLTEALPPLQAFLGVSFIL